MDRHRIDVHKYMRVCLDAIKWIMRNRKKHDNKNTKSIPKEKCRKWVHLFWFLQCTLHTCSRRPTERSNTFFQCVCVCVCTWRSQCNEWISLSHIVSFRFVCSFLFVWFLRHKCSVSAMAAIYRIYRDVQIIRRRFFTIISSPIHRVHCTLLRYAKPLCIPIYGHFCRCQNNYLPKQLTKNILHTKSNMCVCTLFARCRFL